MLHGAALLGMQAVGLLPGGPAGLVDAGDRVPVSETRRPTGDAAVYERRLPLLDEVHDALTGVLDRLAT